MHLGEFSLQAHLGEGEERQEILDSFMHDVVGSPKLFEMIPFFEADSSEDWGWRPKAPPGKERMVDSIMGIWEKSQVLTRWKDGNPDSQADESMTKIDPVYALRHTNTIVSSWQAGLTKEQYEFVVKKAKYFRKIARSTHRLKEACHVCGTIDGIRQCMGCGTFWYCSVECQKEDWSDHKK